VILCEGKTDNVYLVHAIRQLAPLFPQLAEMETPSKPKLKIRFYKYTRSSTSRILGLGGGASHLKKWMVAYEKAMRKYKAPGKANPVIVVVDHDSAGGEIINYAEAMNKQTINNSLPYLHVRGNLYVVTIPLPKNASSVVIVDCFEPTTLSILLEGKTLSLSDPIDEKVHFGKHVFAQKVITPNAATIDFHGFIPLLSNISAAIAAHKAAATVL
jgi:RNA-directed DNA polymerase